MTTEDTNEDKVKESADSNPAPFNPDEETVTDAWEGVFLHTNWGYNQTNIEFARIIDVSDTGKTVVARRVVAERVDTSKASEHLRPKAEQFGDEFRLHVRNAGGDPVFRGTYPTCSDGEMDGPTRRGSFFPFGNSKGHSIRQTTPNHGH